MNRRAVISLLTLAGAGLASAQTDPGKDIVGMVAVTVYHGTDVDASAAGPRAKPVPEAVAKRFACEERLKFSHYSLLGQDTKPLFRSYENWAQPLPPSNEILLRFEAQSKAAKGTIRLDLELWLGRKKILKTDAAMTAGKPLLVLGPEWRGGRLIISVELAPGAPKGQ